MAFSRLAIPSLRSTGCLSLPTTALFAHGGSSLEPPTRGQHTCRTDLALIVLSVIWGVNFSVIKIALREFDPLAFNGIRFVLASLTLFVFLRLSGPVPFPARRHWGRVVFLGLLANVVYQLLFIYGVDRTLAGNAGLVLATTPVWTLILASVSGQEHHGFPVWGGVTGHIGGDGARRSRRGRQRGTG